MNTLKQLLYQDWELPSLTRWEKTKRRWARVLGGMPKNSAIYKAYNELVTEGKRPQKPAIARTLTLRKIRTMSGVAPFAVMMGPFKCPGKCTYCVLEPGMPKSYMSDEPAAARAKGLKFDPHLQVQSRITSLEQTGHHPEKIQIIVIGGTFSAYPDLYKKRFLKAIYDSCNLSKSKTIFESHATNEHAKYRIIGMSIETRPDWVTDEEIKLLRNYGVTKVQLGVQALDDKILKLTQRGHGIEAVKTATKKLRDAGFKINYHFMPNLPGSNPKKDVAMLKKMFSDPDLRPDTLKIYPCIVIPTTKLHQQWKRGEYTPYDDDTLRDVLIKCYAAVPEYCRVDRLQRDITRQWTAAGTLRTNMRQIVEKKMAEEGIGLREIRSREVRDHRKLHSGVLLKCKKFIASGGTELFLNFTDKKHIYGLLRLRFPGKLASRKPLLPELKNAALIRELHVFGQQLPIAAEQKSAAQHQSLGKQLVTEAERRALKAGYHKIAIISGIGVRGYYRKLGYELEGTYMVKNL